MSEIMRGEEIEQGTGQYRQRGCEPAESSTSRFGPAESKDPQADSEENQTDEHGDEEERSSVCRRKHMQGDIHRRNNAGWVSHLNGYVFTWKESPLGRY